MELIKDYMDDTVQRHLLNGLTQEIFGFSFEDWYSSGYYAGEYIPYSYIENGRIVANASANVMKMIQSGDDKLYIQIGTVMTRPEYRNRGLARELIQWILSDYAGTADGFYLYGNLSAAGFYDRLGFCRLNQWRYRMDKAIAPNKTKSSFVRAGEDYKDRYIAALHTAAVNPVFDQRNRASLQLFYTGNMENVYYCEEIDCFVVVHTENDVLHLDSVISSQKVLLIDILERVDIPHRAVILGFTPGDLDLQLFAADVYNGGEDYRLFYKGDSLKKVFEDKLYFPIMSHA